MTADSVLLLTCAGGHLVHCLVRALKAERPNRRIVGVDARQIGIATGAPLDATYKVPMPNEPKYIESIMQICLRERVTCILPGSDDEAQVLSGALSAFASKGIKINAMPEQQVRFIRDKQAVYEELARHGVNVPRSYPCSTALQLRAALENIGFPRRRAVMRPITGSGSRLTFIIEEPVQSTSHPHMRRISAAEAEHKLKNQETMLISEFIEGAQISIDVLANHGTVVQLAARACLTPERLPYTGNRLIVSDAIDRYVREIAKTLRLHGLLDIDAALDAKGNPWLIEINPRQSGSVAASLVVGIPLITQLEDMLDGLAVSSIQPTKSRAIKYDGLELRIEPA